MRRVAPHISKGMLDWFYMEKQMSLSRIASIYGTSSASIWRQLKKQYIPVRPSGYAQHLAMRNVVNLSDEALQFLQGELLGDMGMWSQSAYSVGIVYTSKHEEYVTWLSNQLSNYGIKQKGTIREYKKAFASGNVASYFLYASRDYKDLRPVYDLFYPRGRKILPREIKITPLTLRQWYIGDGGRTGPRAVKISTYSFHEGDVDWARGELRNLGFSVSPPGKYNIIYIRSTSAQDFLDYIGPCPVSCYEYKWALT